MNMKLIAPLFSFIILGIITVMFYLYNPTGGLPRFIGMMSAIGLLFILDNLYTNYKLRWPEISPWIDLLLRVIIMIISLSVPALIFYLVYPQQTVMFIERTWPFLLGFTIGAMFFGPTKIKW